MSLSFLLPLLTSLGAKAAGWSTIFLQDAVKDGAVCLDGTPGAFHWRPSAGSTGFLIHLQGGGWCVNEQDCLGRSKTNLGSSSTYEADKDSILAGFDGGEHGFMSSDPNVNPKYWNYNKIYARYCDGASFTGNVDSPVIVGGNPIYFRGRRVLNAMVKYWVDSLGMGKASDVVLNGCSAGGLAVFHSLDHVRALLPASVPLAGIPECGLFMDLPDWRENPSFTPLYQYVFKMQNSSANVNQDCIQAMSGADAWKCFMAQYTLPYIKTPYFLVNSLYDSWQASNILRLSCAGGLDSCSSTERAALENLRNQSIAAVIAGVKNAPKSRAFLYSCYEHCGQFCHDDRWGILSIQGQTLRSAFEDWHQGTRAPQISVDCVGPNCNPTCH